MLKANSKYEISKNGIVTIIKSGYEYASEFIESIPIGYIDKTVCGCGFTSIALENKENVIIAMPTKILVNNKVSQYPNKRSNNFIIGVDGKVTINKLTKYVDDYIEENKPIKIAVTYDSLYKVESFLNTKSYNFKLIIDESDKLLHYAHLKSKNKKTVDEISILDYLYGLAKKHKEVVSFISATPINLMYMPKWISQLKQYKFVWKNTTKFIPDLIKSDRPIHTLKQDVVKSIKTKGYFLLSDNTKIKKVIIFLNSVTKIMDIINDLDLGINEVSIICAESIHNNNKIRPYNRLYNMSELPTYTFVTSTGFQGIDIEDSEAMTIILSTTSSNYSMIDMNFDMKQAMSRNRSKENPYYGRAIFLYKQTIFDKSESEMLTIIKQNKEDLLNTISVVDNIDTEVKRKSTMKYLNQSKDFVTYVKFEDSKMQLDSNVFNADKFFILETRKQFTEGFEIQSEFKQSKIVSIIESKSPQYTDYANEYSKMLEIKKSKWESVYYNRKYKKIIKNNYKKYGKILLNYTQANKLFENIDNNKNINKSMNKEIKAELNKCKLKTKKYSYIETIVIQKVIEKYFNKYMITDKPKSTYILNVFNNIKRSTIKNNNKLINIYRFEKKN